jgi:hypothetical protein
MPPKWLTDYWKSEPNWVKRFVQGSFELNMVLCGEKPTKDTIWKKQAIDDFLAHMSTIKQQFKKKCKLYRGSSVLSPTMNPACLEMENCQFMSTSKSLAIANEFAGKKGFVHILTCEKGVEFYDFEELYGSDKVSREKEVLLYPGCHLKLDEKKGNKLYWTVTART